MNGNSNCCKAPTTFDEYGELYCKKCFGWQPLEVLLTTNNKKGN